ncbi:hypothetical protein CEP53_013454 [Fusarium sp. AF-6]|nr:hypothetical protein CEP53_013454 [Fusarium sp. AF-6]
MKKKRSLNRQPPRIAPTIVRRASDAPRLWADVAALPYSGATAASRPRAHRLVLVPAGADLRDGAGGPDRGPMRDAGRCRECRFRILCTE